MLAQFVGVLDGLAAALPEVRHHRVHGIAQQYYSTLGPGPRELGPPVVQVALLHGLGGRLIQNLEDLVGPVWHDAVVKRDA